MIQAKHRWFWRQKVSTWLQPHKGSARTRAWQGIVPQIALIAGALVLYYAVRGLSQSAESQAMANAQDLLSFERALSIDWELGAQNLILDRPGWVSFFNWIYVWTYWPILLGTMIFLWVRHRHRFTIFRDALILSGAVGLVIFAVYPVAPPRFLDGFTDTVAQSSREHFLAHPSGLINEFAALPSFHVGWDALAAVMLAACLPRKFRILAVIPPLLMSAAIVFTANHYVIDAVAGIGLSLAGLAVAHRIHRVQEAPPTTTRPYPVALPWATAATVEQRPERRDVA